MWRVWIGVVLWNWTYVLIVSSVNWMHWMHWMVSEMRNSFLILLTICSSFISSFLFGMFNSCGQWIWGHVLRGTNHVGTFLSLWRNKACPHRNICCSSVHAWTCFLPVDSEVDIICSCGQWVGLECWLVELKLNSTVVNVKSDDTDEHQWNLYYTLFSLYSICHSLLCFLQYGLVHAVQNSLGQFII